MHSITAIGAIPYMTNFNVSLVTNDLEAMSIVQKHKVLSEIQWLSCRSVKS